MDAKKYQLADDPIVDLEQEDVRLKDGTRLTEQVAEQIAAEAIAAIPAPVGRPSMSGSGKSPQVAFRIPPALRERAERRAAEEHKSLSELAREALDAYV